MLAVEGAHGGPRGGSCTEVIDVHLWPLRRSEEDERVNRLMGFGGMHRRSASSAVP